MKKEEYPIYTIIMRHYSLEQATTLTKVMEEFKDYFCVEVTLNTDDAFEIIHQLNEKFGESVKIGAGTVRNMDDLEKSVSAGARFVLGPHMFTKEMLEYCQENNIVSVPAGMTPSEISFLVENGADIVKVFPAAVVQPRFFKDVQGPLGELSLMAVGGVSPSNAEEFLSNGAKYLGFGSNLFTKEILEQLDEAKIKEVYQNLVNLLD